MDLLNKFKNFISIAVQILFLSELRLLKSNPTYYECKTYLDLVPYVRNTGYMAWRC